MIVTNSEGLTQDEVDMILGEPDRRLAAAEKLLDWVEELAGQAGFSDMDAFVTELTDGGLLTRWMEADAELSAIKAGPLSNGGGDAG